MRIEFDTTKDRLNIDKHGVSLNEAGALEWDAGLTWDDTRKDYGEPRQCGLVPIGARLYHVVFVERGSHRRIISLRKANRREVKRYADQD
ncbi:MAG: hypothetical protein RLZZ09_1821 [Pseudomonadota bacterium]|jgi:uncharacterized DUF497 family protein